MSTEQGKFQVIVKCGDYKVSKFGLVLPNIIGRVLPSNCRFVKLVDQRNVKKYVLVSKIGDELFKIEDCELNALLSEYKNTDVNSLCFSGRKKVTFDFQVYLEKDLEWFVKIKPGGAACRGCLVEANDEVYKKLILSLFVLWDVTVSQRNLQDFSRVTCGEKQYLVNVICYDYGVAPNYEKVATGFEARGWEKLCRENSIETGCVLKVTNMDNLQYGVHVFKYVDVGAELVSRDKKLVNDDTKGGSSFFQMSKFLKILFQQFVLFGFCISKILL